MCYSSTIQCRYAPRSIINQTVGHLSKELGFTKLKSLTLNIKCHAIVINGRLRKAVRKHPHLLHQAVRLD